MKLPADYCNGCEILMKLLNREREIGTFGDKRETEIIFYQLYPFVCRNFAGKYLNYIKRLFQATSYPVLISSWLLILS